ncbi:MAG: oxidoreductase [Solirubrobacteraceae bacterium]|nr:oxidoreductase [Solirubrobacteraceae bacterium]
MGPLDAYDRLVGSLDSPLFVVTVRHGETRAGCLIGFGGQVSIDPRRFLACLSDKNRTYRVAARGAEHLALHLVPPEARELAELFGGETGDDVDKFEHCAWHEGPHGLPILDACPDWFAGRVLERHVLGDHVGFLLEPVAAAFAGAGRLHLEDALDIDPGHDA